MNQQKLETHKRNLENRLAVTKGFWTRASLVEEIGIIEQQLQSTNATK